MIAVNVHSLVVTEPPHPSMMLLCPDEDLGNDDACRLMPILIGSQEATHIGMAMRSQRPNRPTTHDLFMDALTNLDTTVSHVEIYHVEKRTFFSRLILKTANRTMELDARPSDSIALAIRQNAPIYVDEEIFERSFVTLSLKNPDEQHEIDEFHSFVQNLDPEDFIEE